MGVLLSAFPLPAGGTTSQQCGFALATIQKVNVFYSAEIFSSMSACFERQTFAENKGFMGNGAKS
jgi:hypothetical protein